MSDLVVMLVFLGVVFVGLGYACWLGLVRGGRDDWED